MTLNLTNKQLISDDQGLILILRPGPKPRQSPRSTTPVWKAILTKYAEPERIAPQPTTLWRKLGLATGYNYRDISGFAREEGYKPQLDNLMPIQKVWLRNIVLCNWAVRDGYFKTWIEADEAFSKLWGSVEEKALIDAWVSHCQNIKVIQE